MHQIIKKGSCFRLGAAFCSTGLKSDGIDSKALVGISIGDPALITGGSAPLFYSAIVAGASASVFAWWYANRKASKSRIGSPASG